MEGDLTAATFIAEPGEDRLDKPDCNAVGLLKNTNFGREWLSASEDFLTNVVPPAALV